MQLRIAIVFPYSVMIGIQIAVFALHTPLVALKGLWRQIRSDTVLSDLVVNFLELDMWVPKGKFANRKAVE